MITDRTVIRFASIGMLTIALEAGVGMWYALGQKEPLKKESSPPSYQVLPVYERNVLGDERPETYIEVNGVKYFSRFDGRDVSDLVRR